MKIKYEYVKGQAVEIEVEDSLGEVIVRLDKDEYNANRKETRRHESYSGDGDKRETLSDPSSDVVAAVIRNMDNEELYRAIGKLQPQQQELIRLVYFEDRKIIDIARAQGVTESSIRDRLRKIYGRLKKLLK